MGSGGKLFTWSRDFGSWDDMSKVQVSLKTSHTITPDYGLPEIVGWQDIPNATGTLFRIPEADREYEYRVRSIFLDKSEYVEVVDGRALRVPHVVTERNQRASGSPRIVGKSEVGKTLYADLNRISDADGLPESFSYQWLRVEGETETAIEGATFSTYRLSEDDVGRRFKLRVRFVDQGGFSEGPLVSAVSGEVQPGPTLLGGHDWAPRGLHLRVDVDSCSGEGVCDWASRDADVRLTWRDPSKAPQAVQNHFHDGSEEHHKYLYNHGFAGYEVEVRERGLGESWTDWRPVELCNNPPRLPAATPDAPSRNFEGFDPVRDCEALRGEALSRYAEAIGTVRLDTTLPTEDQDREWRVRAVYDTPNRVSRWITTGYYRITPWFTTQPPPLNPDLAAIEDARRRRLRSPVPLARPQGHLLALGRLRNPAPRAGRRVRRTRAHPARGNQPDQPRSQQDLGSGHDDVRRGSSLARLDAGRSRLLGPALPPLPIQRQARLPIPGARDQPRQLRSLVGTPADQVALAIAPVSSCVRRSGRCTAGDMAEPCRSGPRLSTVARTGVNSSLA